MGAVEGGTVERRAPRFVYLTDASRTTPRFGWRLDAANHRPLGRGIELATTLEACQAAATLLRRQIESAAQEVVLERARGAWMWRLDSAPATCLHPYARRVECLRAFGHFCEAAAAADPLDGVVRDFGPHSLRDFDPRSTDRRAAR